MGDFRIVIDAVGGHGQDREKKDGEVVDFTNADPIHGSFTPEAIAQRLVGELKRFGTNVTSAKVIHWPMDSYPDRTTQIEDNLLTGIRKGNF